MLHEYLVNFEDEQKQVRSESELRKLLDQQMRTLNCVLDRERTERYNSKNNILAIYGRRCWNRTNFCFSETERRVEEYFRRFRNCQIQSLEERQTHILNQMKALVDIVERHNIERYRHLGPKMIIISQAKQFFIEHMLHLSKTMRLSGWTSLTQKSFWGGRIGRKSEEMKNGCSIWQIEESQGELKNRNILLELVWLLKQALDFSSNSLRTRKGFTLRPGQGSWSSRLWLRESNKGNL